MFDETWNFKTKMFKTGITIELPCSDWSNLLYEYCLKFIKLRYCILLFANTVLRDGTSITLFFIMLSETWLADPYVCARRASNSARVKVDQTRRQGLGNCIAFISWYRYCWESGRTSGYRVSGCSPNRSAPTSARRISNANATRVAKSRGPSFVPSQSYAFSSSPKPYSLFALLVSSSITPVPSFLFFSIRSPSGKKVETFPTFSLFPTRPRAQFYRKTPLRGLLWRT